MCPEVGQIEARVLNRECSSVWPIPNETSTAPVFVCGARSPCVEFIISFLIETEVLGPCCFCVFYSWLKECLKSLYRLSPYCVRCALREAVGFRPQLQSSIVALDSSLRLFQCLPAFSRGFRDRFNIEVMSNQGFGFAFDTSSRSTF